jgi:hypothetical protein
MVAKPKGIPVDGVIYPRERERRMCLSAVTVWRPGYLGQFQLSFPLSLGGYLAHPVMIAKPKGNPVERRDFSRGKGYSSAG